jgi:hypothetical protein
MACQLHLSQLLTNPEDRRHASFTPKFDDLLKELPYPSSANIIDDIIKYLSTYGTPYYRHVLSPVEGMANLFPDYVPLVAPISLTAEDIFDNLPNETNRLWFVGLALSKVEADGSLMTPLKFFLHDLFHLSVYAQNTHLAKWKFLYAERFIEDKLFLPKQRNALYKAQELARDWINEAADEEEKTLRLFVSFYLFHESIFPVSIGDVFRNSFKKDSFKKESKKFLDLSYNNSKHLRNPRFYRTLLPESMQGIFVADPYSGDPRSDEETSALEKIMEKIRELYEYISGKSELTEDEKTVLHSSLDIKFYRDCFYEKTGGDDVVTRDPDYYVQNNACLFYNSRGSISHILLLLKKEEELTDEERGAIESLERAVIAQKAAADAAGAGAGGHK